MHEVEIKDQLTMEQRRNLLTMTKSMKDLINNDEFNAIMEVYKKCIKRIEKESGIKL